jgi:hypothetical protein
LDSPSPQSVFLSHQGSDHVIAEALVELLTRTLPLKRAKIRCTTPKRSKLPIGSEVRSTLAREVIAAPVFVCLVTKSAARAPFVRFEIDARLKSGKPVFPVLGVGARPSLIPEIEARLALKCDDRQELFQFVREVAKELGMGPAPLEDIAAAVEDMLRKVAASETGWWARSRGPILLGAMAALSLSAVSLRSDLLDLVHSRPAQYARRCRHSESRRSYPQGTPLWGTWSGWTEQERTGADPWRSVLVCST